jgi:tRNA nucleotidyltransferase (CCA-adding enzyme)
MRSYLVGGAVRDKLLGLPVRERDWVVVGATPAEMLEQGYLKVGKDFPVFLHPTTKEEYALARTERKIGKGYYGFECHASREVTLEEDLLRRDLTINALALGPAGELIDPFNGLNDIHNRVLRHVSASFTEDPVRILRVARFLARFAPLGFKIHEETQELMANMVVAGEVDALVPERVWKELEKALQEKAPTEFFLCLRACGALKNLFPALDKLWGIPQTEKYHPEIDTGIHVMMALALAAQLTGDPVTRFAVVCHDLGKGETPVSEWPSHRGHEERGVPLIRAFADRFHIPREYKELAILVSRFHLHCHKVNELRPETLLKILEKLDAFRQPERFQKFLTACEADARGRKGFTENAYPQAEKMRQALNIAKAVDIKPLIAAGLTGEKLGVKIKKLRSKAIKTFFSC